MAWTYGYDSLDRLTSASKTGTTYGWTYDADGNRQSQTGTSATTYNIRTSNNQIVTTTGGVARTYGYNAAGMAYTYGSYTFSYNNRGRMMGVSAGTTGYVYNALGQLVKKSGTGGTTLFVYDESGHLVGEYSSTGALVQETIWLGDTPVATLRPSGSTVAIYCVHSDHLNSPKKISRPSDNKLDWRWDRDPFGTASPNQNPASLGTFVYNLRFPGQMYLSETGLNYNYFRDFDSQVGRYNESDAIGILGLHRIATQSAKQQSMLLTGQTHGGAPIIGVPQTNLYDYVSNDPVEVVDPRGQFGVVGVVAIGVTAAVAGEVIYAIYKCAQACDANGVCPDARNSPDPEIEQARNTWVFGCKLRCVKSFGEAAKVGPW